MAANYDVIVIGEGVAGCCSLMGRVYGRAAATPIGRRRLSCVKAGAAPAAPL